MTFAHAPAASNRRPAYPALLRCPEPDPTCPCHGDDAAAGMAAVLAEPGRPLEPGTRAGMESLFGRDFASVRVHAGGRPAESARSANALAYSLGSHVVFGADRYAPGTATGDRLLAHELAHVVQQGDRSPDEALRAAVSGPGEAAKEREADDASHALEGGSLPSISRSAGAGLLRQAASGATGPAAPPPAPTPPAREERLGIGRQGHRADAELDRQAAPGVGWLTARVKIKFQQVSSQPWPTPARFAAWQADFVRTVQERWSFKHFLAPETPCPGEPSRVVVRVQVIPVTSGQHVTANVAYTTSRPQSSVGGHVATLDTLDTQRRSDIPQVPAEHEFGHMLGLPHVRCNTNADDCYGVTSEERADVMGSGSYVSPLAYRPFAEMMRYFTGCNWRVVPASFIPTSRGPLIGGIIGGILGAAAGAGIGFLLGGPLGALIGGVAGLVGGALLGRAAGAPAVPS